MKKWHITTALLAAIFFSSVFSSNVMAERTGFSLNSKIFGTGTGLTTNFTKRYYGRQEQSTLNFGLGVLFQGNLDTTPEQDHHSNLQEQPLQLDPNGLKLNPVIALGLSWQF